MSDGFATDGQARRHFGVYPAIVTDIVDPDNLGRIEVKFPSLGGDGDSVRAWATLLTPYADDNQGFLALPAVDTQVAIGNRMNVANQATVPLGNGYRVVTEMGADAQEASNLVLLMKVVDLLVKPQVTEAVAIVRKKFLFAFKVLLHGLQPHADIGGDPGIGKSNSPIMNVAVDQLQILAALR